MLAFCMSSDRTAQPGGKSPPEPKLKQRKRYATAAGFKALLEVGKYAIREVPRDTITKAVVQVEFSPPNRRELELAGQPEKEAEA